MMWDLGRSIAAFAALSAASLPAIPTCAGIQHSVIFFLGLLLYGWILVFHLIYSSLIAVD